MPHFLNPIDLVPDFVPVLGYLDDLVVVSFGVLIIRLLVPAEVMEECRKQAAKTFASGRPVSQSAAVVVILVWVAGLAPRRFRY